MFTLGVILLILGLIFGIQILWVLGLALLIIGVVLFFVRPGGRVWY